jgi:hypothetical protein
MINTANPSAGVYASELDLSLRASARNTTIGAIVGAAARGPVNKAVFVSDAEDFRALFGKSNAKRYGFMSFSALTFLKSSSSLFVTRVVNEALTAGAFLTVDDSSSAQPLVKLNVFDDGKNTPLGKDDPMSNLGFNPGDSGINNTLLFFCAANPGMWNNTLSVRIRPSNPNGLPIGTGHDTKTFYVDVFEDYKGTRDAPSESFLCSRNTEVGQDGQPMFVESVINVRSNLIRVRNNPHCAEVPILAPIFEFLDGGSDGKLPAEHQISKAWELYDDRDTVTCNVLINGGYTTPTIHRKMDAVAQTRGDAFAILDAPSVDFRVTDAIRYRRNDLNLNSSYSAMYLPDVMIKDETTDNRKLYIPVSGFAAAAFANTDNVAALWFAPAGLARGKVNVQGLRTTYKLGARDALDQAQLNYVRFIPGQGYVIWNQDTLQSHDSALSNINVRRLVNFLKYAISDASEVGVFDPNDEQLRSSLRGLSDSVLRPVLNGRGLYAYEVVCDERNNKSNTIANGDLYLDIYIDPVIPAKRLHIRAHIMPTGVNYTES